MLARGRLMRAGVVAAPDERAAQAGVSMLNMGGNAVDAAIAAAFAIGVVEPHMSGLGGGTWLVESMRDLEVLSYSQGGRTRFLMLPAQDVAAVQAATARYRAALAKIEADGEAGRATLINRLKR